MHKYHISTIANLLLDMEFIVDDAFLEAHQIEKGIQTMIDVEQHTQILGSLQSQTAQTGAGGACCNSAFAAATLGASTMVNGQVGNDDQAKVLTQSLASVGMATNTHDKLYTTGDTGKCIILITPDAERTMLAYLGVSTQITLNTLDIEGIVNSQYFLVEGFQCIPEQSLNTTRKAIQLAHSAGAKIAISLCDEAIVEYFYDQIWQFINAAPVDILFCNEHEARGLTQTQTLADATQKLQKIAKQFVITKGAQGALIWNGATLFDIPGITSQAIDTTGAGDLFVGVFLWALTHGYEYLAAGQLANKAAAQLVCQYGPRLSPAALKAIVRDFQQQTLKLKEENTNVMG